MGFDLKPLKESAENGKAARVTSRSAGAAAARGDDAELGAPPPAKPVIEGLALQEGHCE